MSLFYVSSKKKILNVLCIGSLDFWEKLLTNLWADLYFGGGRILKAGYSLNLLRWGGQNCKF